MMTEKHKKPISPLPYPWYFYTVAIITLIGLLDSLYLSISHYRVYADIGYESFCAISRALNCDTVSQSPYSIFLGVPIPVWGIMGYAFFLFLLGYAWPGRAMKKRPWTLLFLLSLAFTFCSVVLAGISTFWIHSYCVMCILSYAVNLLLLYFTWIVRKRFQCEQIYQALRLDFGHLKLHSRYTGPLITLFIACTLLMILFFPPYWQFTPPALSRHIPTGVTEDGYPWIGARNPDLTIIEFADYRCFQCKKMHFYLRRLIAAHPDQIRLIHRNFPMDHAVNPIVHKPFHKGSAKLAIISIFAEGKNKFWQMNDILFGISRQTDAVNIRALAEEAGISDMTAKQVFRNRQLWNDLKRDIQAGLRYGLTGTPGFVIDGKVFEGRIPAEILRKYGNF